VLDARLRIPDRARVLDDDGVTTIITTSASSAERRAEIRRRGVSVRYVDQDAWSQGPFVERLTIPAEGDLIVRTAGDVIEGRARHLGASQVLELEEVREGEAHARGDGLPRLMGCPARANPYADREGWPVGCGPFLRAICPLG